nr:hypothetical protein [Tanacetum cinerariifolium]
MSKSDIVFEEIKMMFQQLMEILNEENQAKIEEMNQVTHTSEPSRRFNSICYDNEDDEDEERTIPLRNEELSTIPEKESDEFRKSSVDDLVPIPSESEDTSESDSECILPSDDESLSDEDVPDDKVKIYLNPLFEFDDEYISSDVNPLFDEVLEDIEFKDSYDSNLDESTFLVTPLSDYNEDKYFTLSDDVELLLHRDPYTLIMSVVSILEGFTDELPLEENDDLFDLESKENDWKNILYDGPIDDLTSKDKVFTSGFVRKKFLQHM